MFKRIMEFPMEIKSVGDLGYFAGYASMFDYVDNQMDVVTQGSFLRTLSENMVGDIKLLWQHNPQEPIGFFTNIVEDEHGLYVEGYIQPEIAKGREAYALLKSGAVRGLSIGYNVKDYSVNNQTGVRAIHDLDLHEISLVTFPANDMAKVIQVKSGACYLTEAMDKLMACLDEIEFKAGYNSAQPRVSSGNSGGGQWTDDTNGKIINGRLNADIIHYRTSPSDDEIEDYWDDIDEPLSDFDMEKLVLSVFGVKGLATLARLVFEKILGGRNVDLERINSKNTADKISKGHAYEQHVIKKGEFPDIKSPKEFASMIKKIMDNPTAVRYLKDGKIAYWDESRKVVVIMNPRANDLGSAFKSSFRYFNGMK